MLQQQWYNKGLHPSRTNTFTSAQQTWHNCLNKSSSRLSKYTQGKTVWTQGMATQLLPLFSHLTLEAFVGLPPVGPNFFIVHPINVQVPQCQWKDYACTWTTNHFQLAWLVNVLALCASTLYRSWCALYYMPQRGIQHTPLKKLTQMCTEVHNFV